MATPRPSARSLFSRSSYDADAPEYSSVGGAASLRSHTGSSDSESDTEHDVLREEEEREKLLSRGSLFGSIGRKAGRVKVGKRVRPVSRRRAGEVAEMMGGKRLGMEDGGSEEEEEGESDGEVGGLLGEKEMLEKKPRRPTLRKIAMFSMMLLSFLMVLIFASLGLSKNSIDDGGDDDDGPLVVFSNGTHPFHKTSILISLDGMRADFLTRNLTPTLNSFAHSGVSTPYMLPSFPSVTFPNHWTLATGLHPESHGIVGNSFYDPALSKDFYYTDPSRSLQHHWWGGEPLWMTAERQGRRAAVHMWPGSEAPGWGATIVDEFNGTEILSRKVNRMLGWLDMPMHERPQFIAAYVPDVDASGHKYGPNSTETDEAIKSVDAMLHSLFLGLETRNLTEIVNIIIVSDHGMASTSNDQLLYIEDLIPSYHTDIEHTDGWPLYGLRPTASANLSAIHASLVSQHAELPDPKPWNVYLRDQDMPERWHFSTNSRIAPLWIVPTTGWAIVTANEHPRPHTSPYSPKGLHGYDNTHPLMRAIFVARGPAFEHLHGPGREWLALDRHSGTVGINETLTLGEVRGALVRPFINIEVYRLVCQSLDLVEVATNATLDGGIAALEILSPHASEDESKHEHEHIADQESSANANANANANNNNNDNSTYISPTRPEKKPGKIIEVSPGGPPPEHEHEKDGKEKDPNDMNWWEYLTWKTGKMKEKMEGWWGGVWNDADEKGDGKVGAEGKHGEGEGKGEGKGKGKGGHKKEDDAKKKKGGEKAKAKPAATTTKPTTKPENKGQ